jgi:hypothetical protein
MKRSYLLTALIVILIGAAPAYGQYEEEVEKFVEGFVAGNLAIPVGKFANDLDTLNAEAGFGLELGAGKYLSSKFTVGIYFEARNFGVQDLDQNHRVFEAGLYGKYFWADTDESTIWPYTKLAAGLSFSKLSSRVTDAAGSRYRELSYAATLGTDAALGVQFQTNTYGGLYLEGGFHYDFMNNVQGTYRGTDFSWPDNNTYLLARLGVFVNIGRGE